MIILALDSTEKVASCAITDGTRLIACSTVNAKLNHSETLLPLIESVMKAASLKYDDIDIFACAKGPGSFTGVRIGVATIKGLAFAKNKPCVGVSGLLSMAWSFVGHSGIVCPCMDARRNQLYNAVYRVGKDGVEQTLAPERVIMADELADELKQYDEPIYFCGGGYDIIKNACSDNMNVVPTPEMLRYQSAYSVAVCALREYETSGGVTDTELSPSYLRASSAERAKNKEI